MEPITITHCGKQFSNVKISQLILSDGRILELDDTKQTFYTADGQKKLETHEFDEHGRKETMYRDGVKERYIYEYDPSGVLKKKTEILNRHVKIIIEFDNNLQKKYYMYDDPKKDFYMFEGEVDPNNDYRPVNGKMTYKPNSRSDVVSFEGSFYANASENTGIILYQPNHPLGYYSQTGSWYPNGIENTVKIFYTDDRNNERVSFEAQYDPQGNMIGDGTLVYKNSSMYQSFHGTFYNFKGKEFDFQPESGTMVYSENHPHGYISFIGEFETDGFKRKGRLDTLDFIYEGEFDNVGMESDGIQLNKSNLKFDQIGDVPSLKQIDALPVKGFEDNNYDLFNGTFVNNSPSEGTFVHLVGRLVIIWNGLVESLTRDLKKTGFIDRVNSESLHFVLMVSFLRWMANMNMMNIRWNKMVFYIF